ncbi:MAG: hypothetical protein U0Z53_23320 [Blastocatellia bacterium]
MALHRKREEGRAAARLLLESSEPVELPEAEINEEGVTVEREEFRPFLPELLEELRDGCLVRPVPVVMSESLFVVDADTRSFWVRIWHSDESRTRIDRLHVTSCLPLMRGVRVSTLQGDYTEPMFGDDEDDEDDQD